MDINAIGIDMAALQGFVALVTPALIEVLLPKKTKRDPSFCIDASKAERRKNH